VDFAENRKELELGLGLGFIWGFLVTKSRIEGKGRGRRRGTEGASMEIRAIWCEGAQRRRG
jgi:hypothetical protein